MPEPHGGGVEIDCTVARLTAESFFVKVLLSGNSRHPNSMSKRINLGLTGELDATASAQAVEFWSYTPDTQRLELPMDLQLPGCLVTQVYQLSPGELHVDFNCPLLLGSEDACSVLGTLVLANCRVDCDDSCVEGASATNVFQGTQGSAD